MKSLKTTGVVAGRGRGSSEPLGNGADSWLWAAAAVVLLMLVIAGPALPAVGAAIEEFSIVIPSRTVREPEGSTIVLATEPVGEEYVGQTCTATSVAENESSIHPGNNLTVASGDSVVVLEDVEGSANAIVTAEGELVLGSEIVISLVMGPDEVFSAGIEVLIDCSAVESTTTTLEATTTTLAATTTTSGQSDSTSATFPSEQSTSTLEDTVRGTVLTTTTVDDEVEDLVVLPFTGPSNGELLFLVGGAMALVGIILVGSRREDIE
jgi:hypothetical protein